MAQPFQPLAPALLVLFATVLATTAALDTQVTTGPGADTLQSLQQVHTADQSTELGRHRMLPSVYSAKPSATPADTGVVGTPSTAKGRRLQGKQGPDFARKMPYVFPHIPASTGVDSLNLAVKGRKLSNAFDGALAPLSRSLMVHVGPNFARQLPTTFSGRSDVQPVSSSDALVSASNGVVLGALVKGRKLSSVSSVVSDVHAQSHQLPAQTPGQTDSVVTAPSHVVVDTLRPLQQVPKADQKHRILPSVFSAKAIPAPVDVVGTPTTAKGRRLQGKQGPDFARKMPYVFPHNPASVAVDSLSLAVKGRKLSNASDGASADGTGPVSRSLMALVGPNFARQLPTTFSGRSDVQPVANSDASVSASNSVVLGAVIRGRKLTTLSGAGSVVPGHGCLLPTIRNSGTSMDGAPEDVYASRWVAEHVGATSGK